MADFPLEVASLLSKGCSHWPVAKEFLHVNKERENPFAIVLQVTALPPTDGIPFHTSYYNNHTIFNDAYFLTN